MKGDKKWNDLRVQEPKKTVKNISIIACFSYQTQAFIQAYVLLENEGKGPKDWLSWSPWDSPHHSLTKW